MIKFKFEKETKNKIRYAEQVSDNEAEKLGALYVHKYYLKQKFGKYPKTIIVDLRED